MEEKLNNNQQIERQYELFEMADEREKTEADRIIDYLVKKGIYNLKQLRELLENSYILVPFELSKRKDLGSTEKLIFAELKFLSKDTGYCYATNEYLADILGLSKRNISKILKKLKEKGMIDIDIEKNNKGTFRKLWIKKEMKNKDEGGMKSVHAGAEQEFLRATPLVRAKRETDKRNIQKDNIIILHSKEDFAGKEINHLISLFKEVNPNYERLFSNKTQRAALERLVKKFGKDKVENMIKVLPKILEKPYAPTITTPVQLENKLADLIAFLKKEKAKKPRVVEL